jgi:GTP-binding protein
MDKLSGNQRTKNARILDKGHGLTANERVLFSAKTGEGREELLSAIEKFIVSL